MEESEESSEEESEKHKKKSDVKKQKKKKKHESSDSEEESESESFYAKKGKKIKVRSLNSIRDEFHDLIDELFDRLEIIEGEKKTKKKKHK